MTTITREMADEILSGLTIVEYTRWGQEQAVWQARNAENGVAGESAVGDTIGLAQAVLATRAAIARHQARNAARRAPAPSATTPEGMVIAALDRGVDVEARFARWNEDELSEDEDW